MKNMDRRAFLTGIAMLATAAASAAASPHRRLASELPQLDLENKVPRAFSDWHVDRAIALVLPEPDVQQKLDQLYNFVYSRTYVDSHGDRVMFLVAYGADQADRMTLAHLPEACYSSQGFQVSETEPGSAPVAGGRVAVRRLRTRKGLRVEPVTYWTTVGDVVCIDELQRRLVRARYSLWGVIPDGMLVRVSTLDDDEARGFRVQANFIAALFSALPGATRSRLFGDST